jgi:hypothetical protein
MRHLTIAVSALLASGAAALAQGGPAEMVSYCADLKRVVALALTRDGLVSIGGKTRQGDFRDTLLPFTGWKDCSLYGAGMYTCDSQDYGTAGEAEAAQARTAQQVLACLGTEWAEIKERSSPGYVVLHPLRGPVSITLSLDENDERQHVVRFTLFVRR